MELASLFQDSAVLQRNAVIPVWGKTEPSVSVCGDLNGIKSWSRSSASGDFTLYFPEMEAGGPYVLEISAGNDRIVVNDILIGEVWLASGQSNMEFWLSWDRGWVNNDLAQKQCADFFKKFPDDHSFRYFKVPECASSAEERTVDSKWLDIDGKCSAVAAWFGLYLQEELDVPVGIIVSSWGGTYAESWMSPSALLHCPHSKELFRKNLLNHCNSGNFLEERDETAIVSAFAKNLRPDGENIGFARGVHMPEYDDSQWQTMKVPGSWIRQKVAENGAVWIRKKVVLPKCWIGRQLVFSSGGIDKQDITYCNGVEIGRTGSGAALDCWDLPRRYTIKAEINDSPELLIAVRAYSAVYDGAFNGDWKLESPESGESIDLSGEWQAWCEFSLGNMRRVNSNPYAFGPGNEHTPGILFDGMIRPLIPYALAGVLWYQGESNAPYHYEYYDILKALITDWRYHFCAPQLPFLIVQLAGFESSDNVNYEWAYLREAQRLVAKDHPNTYMTVALDCGDKNDIHPQDKDSVGFRMAACALNKVYHRDDIVPGGPELIRASSDAPGIVRLDFAWSSGMYLTDDAEKSFTVSADGRKFIPAGEVKQEGASLLVYSEEIRDIRFIRYAWGDFPDSTVYNGDGFPASPFCTSVEVL